MKIKPIVALLSMLSVSTIANEQEKDELALQDRWFEVEVILFSQLQVDTKEHFPNEQELPPLPSYDDTQDLLSEFIIAHNNYEQAKLAAEESTEQSLDATAVPQAFVNVCVTEQDSELETPDESAITTADKTEVIASNGDTMQGSIVSGPSDISAAQQGDESADTPLEKDETLDQQETVEVVKTEEELAFDALAESLQQSPENMPLTLGFDGETSVHCQQPYIVAKAELQLNDVVTKLKNSKNFKPLLHVAWREKPQLPELATAFRLYAGDNQVAQYQKVHDAVFGVEESDDENVDGSELNAEDTNQQTTELADAEQAQMADPFGDFVTVEPTTSAAIDETYEEPNPLAQQIAYIVDQIDEIDESSKTLLLNQLDKPSLIKREFQISDTDEDVATVTLPLPTHPWEVDGLFRVHLDHYLYITADFNVLSQSYGALVDKTLEPEQEIAFKSLRMQQNRRVRSGEIHYFDHPYMGMIVQIRKFEPPVEASDEEEDAEATKEETNNG
ncbi:CsiV family protein [Thalassotalea agarivorans]|uniref:Peptidoglycan-binding protein, CsiV n=1 Tax=Thalassotalea agarivorans TaxID=349064 RepID=A0A1I0ELQ8_THASX|nr:CsiV family protein [Thalassotalea agarivorans]SET46145.1 Peptidoglycan-binding protein, CsiV [Thalassotalea agarivorans]